MNHIAKFHYLRSCEDLYKDLEAEVNPAIRFSILNTLAQRAVQLEKAYNFIYDNTFKEVKSEPNIGQDDLGDSWV